MRENIVQDWQLDKQEEIDWRDCDTIVENFEAGSPVEEIAENYPTLPVSTIRKVIAFAHKHQPVP